MRTGIKTRSIKRAKGLIKINEWERGVMLRVGKSKGILEPGLHTAFPVIDEVLVVDVRPQEYETSFNVLTQDNYPMDTTVSLRYKVIDAEAAVVKAPENLEQQIDLLLKSEGRSEICKDMSMDYVLRNREALGSNIRGFLNGHVSEWGIDIETTKVTNLVPPEEVPRLQRELYEWSMRDIINPLRAEVEKKVMTIQAEAEATAFRTKAAAKLDSMERYLGIVTEAAGKLTEQYGDKARDVMFILFGNTLGADNPITQKIKTVMQAEAVGEGAKAAADEIKADPKYTYLMTALQNMRGLGLVNLGDWKTLAELDKHLGDKLYPK